MSMAKINPIPEAPKKGGGMFGSVLGGLGALIAAPFTGGASLALAPAAMTAGNIVGEVADPSQPGSMSMSVPTLDSKKPAIGAMLKVPEVQLATMINSKNLLSQSAMPNAEEYMGVLDQGIGKLKARMNSSAPIKMRV